MLKKVCLLLGLALIASVSVRAQGLGDKIEIFGGYSYMHFKSIPAANLNGFDLAGQYSVLEWRGFRLGGIADISGEYGTVNTVKSNVYTYMFGPQISWPHRVTPFVHLLGGLGHFSGGNFTSRGLAYGVGAGVDFKVSKRLSWRILEADAIPTHLGSNDQHSVRVSTGIVFHF